jgi:hypothetical protein
MDFKTCPLQAIIDYIYLYHEASLERDAYEAISFSFPWMEGTDFDIEVGTQINQGGEGGWYTITRRVGRTYEEETFGAFYL